MGEEGQHTRGPWRIEGRRGPGYIISAGTNAEGDGPAAYVGVLDPMFYVAGEPSDLEANARLISSTPDLLAALIRLVEVDDDDVDLSGDEVRSRLAAARAAISRATGGEDGK